MVRILYFFLLGALFYWAVRGLFRKGSRRTGGEAPGEEMVPDPQCGVYIPRSRALSATRGGRQLFFCSEECRKKYLSSRGDG